MEKSSKFCHKEEDEIELPAGFRFHPTDEELITHYLLPKVANNNFSARAIGEADLNSCEPWDLPGRAKMGEKEWYFFCLKDRKYPTGLRANRATDAGYWKATGKDKEIFRGKVLVGMKKTLVFYKGRAPKGENTNWVMHEYRLEGRNSVPDSVKSSKNEWVLCRVFKKSSGGKKTYVPGLASMDPYRHELRSSVLPPLMDSSASYPHVTCFSNPTEDQKPHVTSVEMDNLNSFKTPPPSNPNEILLPPSSSTSYLIPKLHVPNPSYLASISPEFGFFQYQEANHHHAMMMQENNSLLKMLIENDYNHQNPSSNLTYSSDVDCPSSSAGPLDIDSLWNY